MSIFQGPMRCRLFIVTQSGKSCASTSRARCSPRTRSPGECPPPFGIAAPVDRRLQLKPLCFHGRGRGRPRGHPNQAFNLSRKDPMHIILQIARQPNARPQPSACKTSVQTTRDGGAADPGRRPSAGGESGALGVGNPSPTPLLMR